MMGVSQQRDEPDQPVTASEFRSSLDQYAGDTIRERIGTAVDGVWPALQHVDDPDQIRARQNVSNMDEWTPSYREHQRETVIDIIESLYIKDNDVCVLSAPTGSGKSLLIYAVASVVNDVTGRRAFTTTPLNSLIDQIDADEFLNDVITVKGRNNYQCVHPQDAGTTVDEAICQRQSDFDCQFKDISHTESGCPYYGRVRDAQTQSNVVTNLSYLMANSMIPDVADAGFSPRNLLAVDEAQGVEDFVLMFVGFTVGPRNTPIDWDRLPDMPGQYADQDEVIDWIETDLMLHVTEKIEELTAKEDSGFMSEKEQEQLDDLRRFNQRVANFLGDVQSHHWAMNYEIDDGEPSVEFEPITVGRFLDKYLWSQGQKLLCASATIPPSFIEESGLSNQQVDRIDVPSTFPAERRPVITTESVGKMSYNERDKTMPKMADQIGRIADLWSGHKGFVHCNSYSIAERIYNRLPVDVQARTRLQNAEDRDQSLVDWIDAPVDETGTYSDQGGQVFLSVAMDEGVSLDDDLARWQVVAKASYPHLQDERVSYRMDNDTMGGAEWNWYNSKAVINLQQAVGRGMRSKEDWCATYILDDSAVGLIDRNEYLMESWFLDAVDCDFDEDVVSPDNGR